MTDETRDALAEEESFAQREKRKREERFREGLADNPGLTVEQLSERFARLPKDIRAWCRRLGLPLPANSEGEYTIGRRGQGVLKRAVQAHRGRR